MLAKLFGIVLLVIGGIISVSILVALVGTIFGILMFALKLVIPALLVYIGYRLITRDRHRIAY